MSDALDSILLERFSRQHDPVAAPDFVDVGRRAALLRGPTSAPVRRRRRRILIAAALGALVVAGTATAVAFHSLGLFGSASYTVIPLTPGSTVPGLPGFAPFLLPDSPGPSPTVAQCANAWNAQAPRATVDWLRTHEPAGVRISVATAHGTGPFFGALCMVRFFFDGTETVAAQGPWTDGGVPRWQGGVQPFPGPMVAGLLRSSNGDVHADGTISCRVRCSTTAPVPPSG